MLSAAAGNGIDSLLDCDVIMLAAGLSDETHHLFGADQFRRMKTTAIMINMSRGSLIDENALTVALLAGEIAGAGLDVFETEPLPKDSPLWDLPNVYITPHSTPQMPDRTGRSIQIICENVKRYRAGQTMLNLLEERDVYTKGEEARN
jgi:phosphoglycerate dehydrogenase-like enzyme